MMRGTLSQTISILVSSASFALFLTTGAAHAGTAVPACTNTLPESTGNWCRDFTVPQFNPSSGPLGSIDIELTFDVTAEGTLSNSTRCPQDFWFSFNSTLWLELPKGLGTLEPSFSASAMRFNLGPDQSANYGPLTASETLSTVLTGPAMNAFIGTSNIVLPAWTCSCPSVTGASKGVVTSLTIQSSAVLTVDYIDAVVVPEPSSVALLLGGLVFLACKRSVTY